MSALPAGPTPPGARLLPGRDEAGEFLGHYSRAAAERRAELDGLPDSGRGTVPPLGRANARGLPLRGENAGVPAPPGGDVRGARTAAGRAARADPDPRRAGAGRGLPHARARLVHPEQRIAFDFRHESWAGIELPRTRSGSTTRRQRPRSATCASRAAVLGPGVAGMPSELRPLVESGIEVYCYYRHEDEPTAPRHAERLLELSRRPPPADRRLRPPRTGRCRRARARLPARTLRARPRRGAARARCARRPRARGSRPSGRARP